MRRVPYWLHSVTESPTNLEEFLARVGNPATWLRNVDMPPGTIWTQPDEYTNWIEEQRSWRESCAFRDMSYHMNNLYTEGPDALDMFSDIGVNGFENFRTGDPPLVKQLVCCNPDGYVISDGALYYLDEERFVTTSTVALQHWIQYHAETGGYDVRTEVGNNPASDDDPREFRFQIQGPNARPLLEEVVDGDLPDVSLFELVELSVGGRDLYGIGHGMAGSFGLEIAGPYEYHDEIEDAVFAAGEDHGIRKVGTKAYKTTSTEIGWIGTVIPAIYESEELREYREWLGARSAEAFMPIGGSFHSEEISDYYLTPVEMGYGGLIDFDHEYPGRDALRDLVENPRRERVTLVWDDEDVVDVYASLFDEGATNKFVDVPDTYNRWNYDHNDAVLVDGETVGVSKVPSYNYNERSMLSVGIVDTAYSDPGTDVTVVWGDEESANSAIERHELTEITATVAPSPLRKDR